MRAIALEGGDVEIIGALDFDHSEHGLTPRRLPAWTRPQLPGFMELMVTQTAGVRLEFVTDSQTLELDAMSPASCRRRPWSPED